jgi:gentisate 1,2-dioxygenase
MLRDGPVDSHDGLKLRYVNPATGGSPMPTISTFLQLLPHGFAGKSHRQTDGAVYSVVEGQGTVTIRRGDSKWQFDFGPRDHFVVPSWHSLSLTANDECVLFSFSDRPVHQALGIWREERLA